MTGLSAMLLAFCKCHVRLKKCFNKAVDSSLNGFGQLYTKQYDHFHMKGMRGILYCSNECRPLAL